MNHTDQECVRLCLDGHPGAYRSLVERYEAPLVAFMTGRLGDADKAREAAQEAFVRSYFSLSKLRKPGSFFAWLCGIAERVAREESRKQSREVTGSENLDLRAADPPADLETREVVASLGEPYREVILLRYYGGFSCAEVSEKLGVPVGTVTKRLSRAYAMLRKKLQSRADSMEV